ncbi:MAG: DNA-3-methyladenine glycosylase [Firmicutes bacterium ADurb.Bin248]|nr:MAG: DNA-3-methyladenine glycosylase [Firmicutes bacterium ADurb.Bin248]
MGGAEFCLDLCYNPPMYTHYEIKDDTLRIHGIDRLNLARSCACGQSFRWRPDGAGFAAPARGRMIYAEQDGDALMLSPCAQEDVPLWLSYFDLARDYAAIEEQLLCDAGLCRCVPCASGIRVFQQEPFEALVTFILSSNNNVKRISGIVERLCERAGEKTVLRGKEYHLFPAPAAVAALSIEELVSLGAGYRAPFVKQSAARVAGGYDLAALRDLPLDEARKELLCFPGVGPKVADCVLLFSLGHADAFPVDVWIGRAMKALFFEGSAPGRKELEKTIRALGSESGIVQQYIFHYARLTSLGK